jgi:hypothetical protein
LHWDSIPFLRNKTNFDGEGLFLWLDSLFERSLFERYLFRFTEGNFGSQVSIIMEDGNYLTWKLCEGQVNILEKDGEYLTSKIIDIPPKTWICQQNDMIMSSSFLFSPPINENGEVVIEYVAGLKREIKRDTVVYMNTPLESNWLESFDRNTNKPCYIRVVIGGDVLNLRYRSFLCGFSPNEISFVEGSLFKSFGYECFIECKQLQKINIPPKVKELGNKLFYLCTGLTKVIFHPESELAAIGEYSFGQCTSLREIVIPQSIEEISERAFAGCDSLKSMVFNCCNLAHFVGIKNAIPPNVERLELNLGDVPDEIALASLDEEVFPAFLANHCGVANNRAVIFTSQNGRSLVFCCENQGQWAPLARITSH